MKKKRNKTIIAEIDAYSLRGVVFVHLNSSFNKEHPAEYEVYAKFLGLFHLDLFMKTFLQMAYLSHLEHD